MNPEPSSLDEVLSLLHRLYGLPGYALVYISCILFGYVGKIAKFVPNDKIPLLIFGWGSVWNLMLSDTRAPDANLRLWVARNLIIGFIISGVAWGTHYFWLKRWLDPKFHKDES